MKNDLKKVTESVILDYEAGVDKRFIGEKNNISAGDAYFILLDNDYMVDYLDFCPLEELVNICRDTYQMLFMEEILDYEREDFKLDLAQNIYTPNDVLKELVKDCSEKIRLAVVKRINVSEDILEMALSNATPKIRWAIIRKDYVPDSILSKMLIDENITYKMKIKILDRRDISEEVLKIACNDKDDEIRNIARKRLFLL